MRSRNFAFVVHIAIVILGASSTTARGEDYQALVIGNSSYSNAPLLNPKNDAERVFQVLRSHGVNVQIEYDCNKQDMEKAIVELGKKSHVVLFFAGHGFRSKGDDYVLPVRAESANENDGISVRWILERLKNCTSRVLIFDCCRVELARLRAASDLEALPNTELKSAWYSSENTLIWFSTCPNLTADDGKGGNSPFTRDLVSELELLLKNGRLADQNDASKAIGKTIDTVITALARAENQKSHALIITKQRVSGGHLTRVVSRSPNAGALAESGPNGSRSEAWGADENARAQANTSSRFLQDGKLHAFAYAYETR